MVVAALALIFVPGVLNTGSELTTPTQTPPETHKTAPRATLRPELVPICTCESSQGTGKPQHYNVKTGEVLRGQINPQDIGMCQINLHYHGEAAAKAGLDLFTEEDNIKYANQLYKEQGAQPWSWSNHCHKALD